MHLKHGKVTQNMHGASRNYRYVWDVSIAQIDRSGSGVGLAGSAELVAGGAKLHRGRG